MKRAALWCIALALLVVGAWLLVAATPAQHRRPMDVPWTEPGR